MILYFNLGSITSLSHFRDKYLSLYSLSSYLDSYLSGWIEIFLSIIFIASLLSSGIPPEQDSNFHFGRKSPIYQNFQFITYFFSCICMYLKKTKYSLVVLQKNKEEKSIPNISMCQKNTRTMIGILTNSLDSLVTIDKVM